MANDLTKLYNKDNIRRAWRWINTNPSFKYKNFFRDVYSSYALTIEDHLKDIHERLKTGSYEASTPCKVYFPKSPYVMRPYTLLTVEDQIVYQAFANIIAEYHVKRSKHRYEETVFGNLYAGKRSVFFYKNWTKSYMKYNTSIKKAFNQGYNYTASFDLTACYDSIDHKVLQYFLSEYSINHEFIDLLIRHLTKWTSNTGILHGHGIPQGPLASGMISEVVLSFLDSKFERLSNDIDLKYFRYVDDIKIMSKDDISLRQVLTKLDYISKQIGLFSQSSKIEVHRVKDIDKELKNISLFAFEIEQLKESNSGDKAVEKKIFNLVKKDLESNVTEFKMLLANVNHTSKLSYEMLRILRAYPQLFESIIFYFKTYPRIIHPKLFKKLLEFLEEPEVFQIINAYLLDAIKGKLSKKDAEQILGFVKKRWKQSSNNKLHPMYRKVIVAWLLRNNALKYSEIQKYLISEKDWWVVKSLVNEIDINFMGKPSYMELIFKLLKSKNIDIAISAAHEIIKLDLELVIPQAGINYVAQKPLKYAGILSRASSRPSKIHECLEKVCQKKLPEIKWKRVFADQHHAAENKIIRAYGYAQNDISAFINILDSFNDLTLHRLYLHDTSLGSYQLGNIGGVTYSSNSSLERIYPKMFTLCKEIHDKRLECDLSHPITRKTKKYTKPIEYKYKYRAIKFLFEGYKELIEKW